jgi:hypothetical protein
MSIVKLFGLRIKKGKSLDVKVKKSLPISLEVNSLHSRIDSEYRENFPSLARYKELCRDTEMVYRILDEMIVKKDHEDDAIRMRDDLRKKLDALGAKIRSNLN